MASQNTHGYVSYPNSAALSAFTRVSFASNGTVGPAAATVRGDGVNQRDQASGDITSVRLINDHGTFFMNLTGTCSAGDLIYGAANGLVANTSNSGANPLVGRALIAGVSGDTIEVLPLTVA